MLGVPGGGHDDGLARGTRVWHFPNVADQQGHPLVRLQDLHCLVVGRLLEALAVYLDDLITYLANGQVPPMYPCPRSNSPRFDPLLNRRLRDYRRERSVSSFYREITRRKGGFVERGGLGTKGRNAARVLAFSNAVKSSGSLASAR